jgi:tetratricopeptide (TPR) repeat protein
MVYLAQAMVAVFRGDMDRALEQMGQAIAMNPEKPLLYSMRGTLLAASGRVEQALADLERALTLDPSDLTAITTIAYIAWARGDLEAALSRYNQVVELEPGEWLGHAGQAMIAFERGDVQAALDALDRADEVSPDAAILLIARGLVLEKVGAEALATAAYSRARRLAAGTDPSSQFIGLVTSGQYAVVPPYFFLLECVTFDPQENIEKALERCDQALEIDPTYFDALWKRGQLHAARGELEAAVADYTAAIAADPSWPWVYYLRARSLVRLRRIDAARSDLARALELNPGDTLRQRIEALQAGRS